LTELADFDLLAAEIRLTSRTEHAETLRTRRDTVLVELGLVEDGRTRDWKRRISV
jgi:hypothetical protein